jgi:hypothetical protein
MATELTFEAHGAGRLPRVAAFESGGPAPGLKVKFGRFVTGTSEYPDNGYLAADLESITGLTHIVAILPCGMATNGSHILGWPIGWDSSTRTLRAYGIPAIDGNAQTGGATTALSEVATNTAGFDTSTFDAVVIGY